MTGGIVIGLQARVNVTFRFLDKPDIAIEFVVDTGFEGALTLPPGAVAALGLPFYQPVFAKLADDTSVRIPTHLATILWDGVEVPAIVLSTGSRPLLGTALLSGNVLVANFEDQGSVKIERLH